MADSPVGRSFGRFQVVRPLGAGAMGTVFEGIDTQLGERVAIKVLRPELSDPAFRSRFEEEAHVATLLQSPYTVRLRGYGIVDGVAYFAMDFVDGPSLLEVIEREGRIEPRRALGLARDVARALEEAGVHGIVHRDIKPANILLTAQGQARLADFGVARRAEGAGMTTAGAYVGTASYSAPEQQLGRADQRSDIYALGATIYHMLAGRPPYAGTMYQVLMQHRDAPFPAEGLAGQPDEVGFLVRRCMSKDPADRFPSASDLAAGIERTIAVLSARPAGASDRPALVVREGRSPAEADALPAAAAGPPNQHTEHCTRCGYPNTHGGDFCEDCGAALSRRGRPPMPTRAAVSSPPGVAPRASGPSLPPLPSAGPGSGGRRGRVGMMVAGIGLLGIAAAAIAAAIVLSGGSDEPKAVAAPTAVPSTAAGAGGDTSEPPEPPTATAIATRPGPTPSPTVPAPTPTARPPLTGKVIFSQTFDSFASSGLKAHSSTVGTTAVEGGKLVLQRLAVGSGFVHSETFGPPVRDVAIRVEATTTDGTAYLACRDDHRYAVRSSIRPATQRFSTFLYDIGKNTTELYSEGASGAIRNDTNVIELVCKGDRVDLVVNGVLLSSDTITGTAAGSVWLGVGAPQGQAGTVAFDNLTLLEQ